MTELDKMFSAIRQVENVMILISGNQYEQYMHGKLNGVYYELKRQLANYNHDKTVSN